MSLRILAPAALFVLAALCAPLDARAQETDSFPLPDEWDVKYLWMVHGNPDFAGAPEEVQQLMQAHFQYQLGLLADGHAIMGGPLVPEPESTLGGITIIRAGSLQEAEAIAAADPAVAAGLMRATVRTWRTPARRPARGTSAEQIAVVSTVEAFFEAMTARDVEASRRVVVEDGQFFSLRPDADGWGLHRQTVAQYHAYLAQTEDTFVERMWDSTVLVDGDVALVWTPYDIFRNGDFLHCGVDAFLLLRTAAGWQMASALYTVEPEGCAPSPLGPLGHADAASPPTLIPASHRVGEASADRAERHRILATVHDILQAMTDRDVATSRRLMLPGAQGISVSRRTGEPVLRHETNEEYFTWLETDPSHVVETLLDEMVLLHGPIAVVWAPYEFHVGGALSHCGVNLVGLVRQGSEWKLADWVWDVRTEGCEAEISGPGIGP